MSEAAVAMVTGAGGGIGRAICEALARDGFRVAACDLDLAAAEATVSASGAGGLAVELDVTAPASVAAGVARIESELGPIDVLVNNAGIDRFAFFVDSDPADWDRVIDVNLKGTLSCAHAVLPGMIERGRGRVVNIGSDAGRVGSSGEAVYSATKGAVIAFTKALALETARSGLTVNCVCPGPTDTPLLDQLEDFNARLHASLSRAIPLRRLGEPADVAGVVAFLASDAAAYLTGQTVSVSGGLTMA